MLFRPRYTGFLVIPTIALVCLTHLRVTNAQEPDVAVDWPDTPAGQRARTYFEAYDADSDESIRRWILQNISSVALKEKPLRKRVAEDRKVFKQIGRLEIGEVRSRSDLTLDVIVRSVAHGVWLRFSVQLESQPPYYWVEMIGRPTKAPNYKEKVYDKWDDLADLAEQVRADLGAPALAVAIARNGSVLERAEIGNRRADKSDPIQPGDLFQIGSITKSFTATMIAELVQRGELSWNTTIGSALSDLPVDRQYRRVTIEQLLRHRGGIVPMPTGGPFESDIDHSGRTPQEGREMLVREVLSEKPIVKPGRRKVYSNAGYVVAAYMAERITGQTWEALMHEIVFEPMMLKSAVIGWPATIDRPNQPRGHFGVPPNLRVQNIDENGIGGIDFGVFLAPAGHVSCSCEDLARFGAAHLQGLAGKDGVLTAETFRKLHTPGPHGDDESGYALGWVTGKKANGSIRHWHNGSGGTFLATLSIYPEDDLSVAIVTNMGISASRAITAMGKAISKRYAAK